MKRPPLLSPPLVSVCTLSRSFLNSLPLSSVSPGGLGPSATYSSNSPASPLSSASLTSPLSPFSMVSGSQGSPTKPGSSEVSWGDSTRKIRGKKVRFGSPERTHSLLSLPQGPHPSIRLMVSQIILTLVFPWGVPCAHSHLHLPSLAAPQGGLPEPQDS